ncbi:fibrinogen-like protein A isoform X1 [Pecten maximus]|uniref:fibrinogen-like protein A isoform X1 n=1 Tax=Pecten maximus TaxID=6579 RepID=UPI0014586019|nr:fibrinogen-like protein A isoform X1 [Pecten maximus]
MMILLLLAFSVAMSFETITDIWTVETVPVISHLPGITYHKVVALSPIQCVVTALTYNRSAATYDWSTHQCLMHDTNGTTGQTAGKRVVYIHVTKGDKIADVGELVNGSQGPSTIPQITTTCHKTTPGIQTCEEAEHSGVYCITPVQGNSFNVYCDVDSEGGPWTVIQNRQSEEVYFYRNWDQYKTGFGDLSGNYWLGNDNIFTLTQAPCILRIEVESLNDTFGYVEYSSFQISSEVEGYALSVSGFTGNISDGLSTSNGFKFSTLDRDNDKDDDRSCAEGRGGAWWYRKCSDSNPNGLYNATHWRQSIYWQGFYGSNDSIVMKTTQMLLKCP